MKILRLTIPFAFLFFVACGGNESADMAEHGDAMHESAEESMDEMAYDGPNAELIAELNESSEMVLAAIDGLSEAQWNYQENPDRWSIAGVTEHIIIAEGAMRGVLVDSVLSGEPASDVPEDTDESDMGIRAMMADRSSTIQTNPMMEPTGAYATPEEAKMAFEAARAKTIEFLKSTDKNLRAYSGSLAEGLPPMDGAQFVIFIASHAKRHVAQIDQVKADEGYPAASM